MVITKVQNMICKTNRRHAEQYNLRMVNLAAYDNYKNHPDFRTASEDDFWGKSIYFHIGASSFTLISYPGEPLYPIEYSLAEVDQLISEGR
jgi:hypothetical protein